jgi:hypothetical protein
LKPVYTGLVDKRSAKSLFFQNNNKIVKTVKLQIVEIGKIVKISKHKMLKFQIKCSNFN